jgi:menaquinone-9 beta-reductase
VVLHTSAGEIGAGAVVGADGAKSAVRRGIKLDAQSRVSRTIEILTPEDPGRSEEFVRQAAVFDFSYVTDGLQGYVWDFPSRVKGEAKMNRGACDFRVYPERPMAPMKEMFKEYLGRKGIRLEEHKLMGNPSRWYDPEAKLSAPRVLLAGDAAGIEPLGGDGISAALGYGEVVAEELARASESGDWSFEGYEQRLAASDFGQYLATRLKRARFVYKRRHPLAMRALWVVLGWQLRLRVKRAEGLFE